MTEGAIRGLTATVDHFRLGPVDLPLTAGGATAVIGRSGAGKTTLLRSIAGLVPAVTGRVELDGSDRADWAIERRRIAYVPPGLGLFPHRSVEANVAFADRFAHTPNGNAVPGLLGRFGLAHLRHRAPGSLSTGEQHRVALARALAADPDLLLLDEPLVALDVPARDDLTEALSEVRRESGLPLLFVTHDVGVAYAIADRFLLLERGRPRFLGSPEELRDRPPDAFAARFLGLENIVPADALVGDPFLRWLEQRSGPGGVAFAAKDLRVDRARRGASSARVRHRRATPTGTELTLSIGPTTLRAFSEERGESLPAAGETVGLEIEEHTVRPLGIEEADG